MDKRITKTICVCKAQPIGNQHVDGEAIEISNELPQFDTLSDLRIWFSAEGHVIEAALFRSLPGGTYDHVLKAMLARKASLLRVSHRAPNMEAPTAKLAANDLEGWAQVVERINAGTTTVADAAKVEALVDEMRALQAVSCAA